MTTTMKLAVVFLSFSLTITKAVSAPGSSSNIPLRNEACELILASMRDPDTQHPLNGIGVDNLAEFLQLVPHLPVSLAHPNLGSAVVDVSLIVVSALGRRISFVGKGATQFLALSNNSVGGYRIEHVPARRLDRGEGSPDVFNLANALVAGSHVTIELTNGLQASGFLVGLNIRSKEVKGSASLFDILSADTLLGAQAALEASLVLDTSLRFSLSDGAGVYSVVDDHQVKRILVTSPLKEVDLKVPPLSELQALWGSDERVPLEALTDRTYLWRFHKLLSLKMSGRLSSLDTHKTSVIEAMFRHPTDPADFLLKFIGVDDFVSLKCLIQVRDKGLIAEVKPRSAWMADYFKSVHYEPALRISAEDKPAFVAFLQQHSELKTPFDWAFRFRDEVYAGPFVIEDLSISHFTHEQTKIEYTNLGVVLRSLTTGKTLKLSDRDIFAHYQAAVRDL